MKKFYWTFSTIFVGGLALGGNPVNAQNITCTSMLAAGTYANVSVPSDANCTVGSRVVVTGNVTVASGATLDPFPFGLTVMGSVLSKDAALVELSSSSVGMNVSLVGTTELAAVNGHSSIGGNLVIIGGTGGVELAASTVTGNVLVSSNNTTAVGGFDEIAGNTIGGNLTCVGNTPPPTNGSAPNTVSGHEVGQCAGL